MRSIFNALTIWVACFIFFISPIAEARVAASQCVNGMDDLQINRLYEIGVYEDKIQEMCKDGSLNRDQINQLIMPVKVPSPAQINKCLNDISAIWEEGKEFFEAGLDLGKGAETFQAQCQAITTPAQVNTCITKANTLAAQANALQKQGVTFGNNASANQKQCEENLNNGELLVSLPSSVLRRLLNNNKASDLLSHDWPNLVKNWDKDGKLPEGITPYFPEEREVFYMLGLDDEDLRYLPPRGVQGAGEEWAKNNMNDGLNIKKGTMAGLAITYLNLLLIAVFSPFHLFSCWSRPSVHAFVASSAVYLGLELSLIKKYKALVKRITTLSSGAEAQVDRTLEDVEDVQTFVDQLSDEGKGVVQSAEELKKTCEIAVNEAQAAQNTTPSSVSDAEDSYNDFAPRVDQCIADAQALGVKAEDILAKGLGAIETLKKAGNNAIDQLKLLKYVRTAMKIMKEIFKRKSNAAFIYGGGLTAAGTLATLESMDIYTWGKCEGGGAPPPGAQAFGGLAITAGVFATGATGLKVKAMLDSLGIGDTGPIIGISMGAIVLLIGTIYLWFAKSKLAGVLRAVFFGVAAALGFTAGGLIKKAQNVMSGYIDQMNVLIAGLERTLNNEGFFDDGKEWIDPTKLDEDKNTPVPSDYYDPSVNQVSPDGAQTIPVPTIPVPTLTPPPGFTVPSTPTFPPTPTPLVTPFPTSGSFITNDEVNRLVASAMQFMESMIPAVEAGQTRPTSCYVGKRALRSDPNCNCRKNNSCKKSKVLLPKPNRHIKMKSLKGTTSALTSMKRYADSVYSGNHHMQRVYTKQLMSMEPRLKQENKFVEKVWNNLRKKKKKGRYNFDMRKKNMMTSMQNSLKRDLKKLDPNDRKVLLAHSGGNQKSQDKLRGFMEKRQKKIPAVLKAMKELQATLGKHKNRTFKGIPKKKKKRGGRRDSQKGLNLAFNVEDDAPIHDELQLSDEERRNLSDFEGDDIEKDSNKSIWKIISKRYFYSGIYDFTDDVLNNSDK